MASSEVGTHYLSVPKMSLNDAKCPICFCILIEPVTMPCKHELCRPCFEHTMKQTSLTCPMCRTRFSSWARRAARQDQLINQKRWTQIQKDFPERVRKRLLGLDESLPSDDIARSLSEPGEIRKEYEEQMKQIAEERERNEKLNNESFLNLLQIWKEEAESESKKSGQIKKNEKPLSVLDKPTPVFNAIPESSKKKNVSVAPRHSSEEKHLVSVSTETPSTSLAEESNKSLSCSSKDCSSSTEQQDESTPGTSSGSERKRSGSAQSNDSITEELRHFKPIKIAPKTPPKKMPDGRIIEPLLVQTRPLNLNRVIPSSFSPVAGGAFAQKLMAVCSDRRDHQIMQSKMSDESTETDASLLLDCSKPLLPLEPNLPLTEQTSTYKAPAATSTPSHTAQKNCQQGFEPLTKKVGVAASIAFQDCSRYNNENSLTCNDEPRPKKRKARSLGGRLAEGKQVETKLSLVCKPETDFPGLKSDSFVKEQLLMMKHLKQEEEDRKMALELQKKFDVEAEMLRRGKIGCREPYVLRKKRLPPVPVVSGRRRSQC